MRIIDLFAGPGGWSEGARMALPEATTVGVEIDGDACATATAAGHERIQRDIAALSPWDVARPHGGCDYLHGSPPCQGFSLAGNGAGRRDGDNLILAIESLHGHADRAGSVVESFADSAHDHRSVLTLEPLRWISELSPVYVTLEQVPTVLPVWEAYARTLRSWGYSSWAGCLHAEQYGVPQSRRRAILIARLDGGQASPPDPTHERYRPRRGTGQGDNVSPGWVGMRDAFSRSGIPMTFDWMASGTRPNASIRMADQPSVTLAFGNDAGSFVFGDGPAPSPTDIPQLKAEGRVRRVEPAEAGVIQGFPADYPWRGTRISQLRQIANAVPPPLAAAVVSGLMDQQQRNTSDSNTWLP